MNDIVLNFFLEYTEAIICGLVREHQEVYKLTVFHNVADLNVICWKNNIDPVVMLNHSVKECRKKEKDFFFLSYPTCLRDNLQVVTDKSVDKDQYSKIGCSISLYNINPKGMFSLQRIWVSELTDKLIVNPFVEYDLNTLMPK